MVRSLCVAVAIVSCVVVGLNAGLVHAAQIQGAGARSCATYLSDISSNKIVNAEDIYANWALGYMSRINMDLETSGQRPLDLTPGPLSLKDQKAYLRQYCAKNPDQLFEGAARSLFEHIRTQNGPGV